MGNDSDNSDNSTLKKGWPIQAQESWRGTKRDKKVVQLAQNPPSPAELTSSTPHEVRADSGGQPTGVNSTQAITSKATARQAKTSLAKVAEPKQE